MNTSARSLSLLLLALTYVHSTNGYVAFSAVSTRPSFVNTQLDAVKTNPFKEQGVDFELPDFRQLFDKIQAVSPLAKSIISGEAMQNGLKDLVNMDHKDLPWKRLEKNDRAIVHEIEKMDRFDGHSAPLLRFRSSLKGPLVGEFFGKLIMDLEERKKWDAQIQDVRELYPANDLDAANIIMDYGKFGDCARLGLGYAQTKKAMGITPREQLFLYGLQHFVDGSCLIWGTEVDEQYNHLLPNGPRHTRAKSHLFSAALRPTGDDTFDVEYILQMDIGGNIPSWLSLPKVIDTVKSLFKTAKQEFENGANGLLESFLKEQTEKVQSLTDKQSLLFAP